MKPHLKLFLTAILGAIALQTTGNPSGTAADQTDTPFSATNTKCTISADIVDAPAAGQDCSLSPDTQTLTLYKFALCKSKPAAPTTDTVVDLTDCSSIYDGEGQLVTISSADRAQSTPLSGATKPDDGDYRYLYVELSPTLSIQTKVTFSTVVGDSNDISFGSVCWTIPNQGGTLFNWSTNAQGSMPLVTQCGNAPGDAPGVTSITYNSFNGNSFINAVTNLPISGGWPVANGGAGHLNSLDAYLLGADSKLANPDTPAVNQFNNVARLAGVMTLPVPVTITSATTNVALRYNNSLGSHIATQTPFSSARVPVSKFGLGPFDMTVTATTGPAP
jgi:hypothetical protein